MNIDIREYFYKKYKCTFYVFLNCSMVLQSLSLINREEGVTGLYAGIIPRLLTGLGTVILANVAKQAFSRYIFDPSPIALSIADFVASVI